MRRLRAGLIGSIRAWLPSRRSTAHHIGARSTILSGQVRSASVTGSTSWANGRYRLTGIDVVRWVFQAGCPALGGPAGLLMLRAPVVHEKASGESGVDFEKVVTVIAPGVIDGTRPAHRDYPRREASLIRPRRGCREGAPAAPDHCSKPGGRSKKVVKKVSEKAGVAAPTYEHGPSGVAERRKSTSWPTLLPAAD